MEESKMTKIMIGAAVVILLATGGFAFYTHSVNAKEASAQKDLITNIDKQKEQEAAAQEAKANIPKVDESHPARYTTTPPEQQKSDVNQNETQAITSLSETDIKRLQSYPTYGSSGQGFYENFADFYAKEQSNAEGFSKTFNPATLSDYNNAKVGWLTDPKAVYRSAIGQICIRGILTITYYGDNSFDLTPNISYQREVEYRLENSVKNGKVTLSLNSTHYLSSFQAVK